MEKANDVTLPFGLMTKLSLLVHVPVAQRMTVAASRYCNPFKNQKWALL